MAIFVKFAYDFDSRHADGTQNKSSVFKGGDYMNWCGVVKNRNVMNGVFFRTVCACIGDGATAAVNDAVTALLDAFCVTHEAIIRWYWLTTTGCTDGFPNATQIRCARCQRFGAVTKNQGGKGRAIPTCWSVGYGNVIGVRHEPSPYNHATLTRPIRPTAVLV